MTQATQGDGPMAEEVDRVLQGARDALTDDMVTRLAATAGQGLELLDRVNRSGVGEALPAVAGLVHSGDLKRVADLARVLGAAEDALTDDTVTRLAAVLGGGLELLDRVNRSGMAQALPALVRLVESGDLERLQGIVRLAAAIEDSLSDDIVKRVAEVATELAALVDKLARSEGFLRLIDVLGKHEVQCALIDLAHAACTARQQMAKEPAPQGGLMGLLRLARDPDTAGALRFVSLLSGNMSKQLKASA